MRNSGGSVVTIVTSADSKGSTPSYGSLKALLEADRAKVQSTELIIDEN